MFSRNLTSPKTFHKCHGTVCRGLGVLCILLKRLPYPCRYYDIIYRFARLVPELCILRNVALDWVFDNHSHRLTSWNQQFLTPTCLEQNAQALRRMGSPPPICFGFVDGTVKLISRTCEINVYCTMATSVSAR